MKSARLSNHRLLSSTCAIIGGLAISTAASAQAAPETAPPPATTSAPVSASGTAAPASAPAQGLEEIVVTAERRSESLQKTPLAVTAISGDRLRALGATTAQDLTQVVPNLVLGETGASAQIGMRGAISSSPLTFADQAVGFSVDGVYIARASSALTALYDIAQVEVLRGPQGTLYGRNTIAGLINVITAKPDLDAVQGRAMIGYGS